MSFQFKGANVTTDFNASTSWTIAQVAIPNGGNCAAGTQLEVDTADLSGTDTDSGFYIEFHN